MLPAEVILAIVGGFLTVLTLFVFFSTGSILAVFMLWAVTALILIVLVYYDFIDLDKLESIFFPEEAKKEEKPAPEAVQAPSDLKKSLVGSEVFNVSQNQFTYNDAQAVCAAYGAKLATLEQIIDAYNKGAEWCNYGWSAGGMALYPTQKATWDELQREIDPAKRTACGRPGVNGGYFNPSTKFGVNCFGFKPAGNMTFPIPAPGTDNNAFRDAVNKFKDMIKSFKLAPFSRQEWSGYDSTPAGQAVTLAEKTKAALGVETFRSYGSQFRQNYGGLVEGFDEADPAYIEAVQPNAAYTASPYGLRGDLGPTGPMGLQGPASTVPGPAGSMGPTGPEGQQGPAGVSDVPGPTGPQGLQGIAGVAGQPGPAGPAGLDGPRGPTGPMGEGMGPTGPAGMASTVPGPTGPKGLAGATGPASNIAGPTGPQGLQGSAATADGPFMLERAASFRTPKFYFDDASIRGRGRAIWSENSPSNHDQGKGTLTTYYNDGMITQIYISPSGRTFRRTAPIATSTTWNGWS
jgi:hypothetical protein